MAPPRVPTSAPPIAPSTGIKVTERTSPITLNASLKSLLLPNTLSKVNVFVLPAGEILSSTVISRRFSLHSMIGTLPAFFSFSFSGLF